MVVRLIMLCLMGLFFIAIVLADEGPLPKDALEVGAFSRAQLGDGLPADWEMRTFPSIENHTRYGLVRDGGRVAVRAKSEAGASSLIRYLRFDAVQYPLLAWRWKIEHVLEKGDLRTKQGDDYAARLYVAFEFEPQRASWWQRMSHAVASDSAGKALPGTILTYIWANDATEGIVVNSPYTDQTKMVVLRSGDAMAGQWVVEQRNIVEDYQRAFGREPPPAIWVGIMTDADNTGEATSALYGDIHLLPPE